MLIRAHPPLHLTYSLNVHPGETWEENFTTIREVIPKIAGEVAGGKPFGLGLRLSRQAADALNRRARLDEFRGWLGDHNAYVFTINAFPYGAFHGTRVKEQVYAPDWRTPERREYTLACAAILSALLPDGVNGSISTVPVSYKPWMAKESDWKAAVANLHACADRLSGGRIRLALEPEPGCVLETTDEAIRFFLEHLSGRKEIGVCFDTCHAAVQFEDAAQALGKYRAAGVPVPKIQLSAALECAPDPERLKPFCEEVYLHQVKGRRTDGSFAFWNDLDCATLARALHSGGPAASLQALRTHFHVPLYWAGGGGLRSTASAFTPALREVILGATDHLEIETYTFNVLPPDLRARSLEQSIVAEYRWALRYLNTGR